MDEDTKVSGDVSEKGAPYKKKSGALTKNKERIGKNNGLHPSPKISFNYTTT